MGNEKSKKKVKWVVVGVVATLALGTICWWAVKRSSPSPSRRVTSTPAPQTQVQQRPTTTPPAQYHQPTQPYSPAISSSTWGWGGGWSGGWGGGYVDPCPACHGNAFPHDSSVTICPTCLGGGMVCPVRTTGYVTPLGYGAPLAVQQVGDPVTCPTCRGLGFLYRCDKCETCGRTSPSSAWLSRWQSYARQVWMGRTGGNYVHVPAG